MKTPKAKKNTSTTTNKLSMSKKGFEMSWSMMVWIIIGIFVLLILMIIMKKSTDPGFAVFKLLGI